VRSLSLNLRNAVIATAAAMSTDDSSHHKILVRLELLHSLGCHSTLGSNIIIPIPSSIRRAHVERSNQGRSQTSTSLDGVWVADD
jgi:hypothetical protein